MILNRNWAPQNLHSPVSGRSEFPSSSTNLHDAQSMDETPKSEWVGLGSELAAICEYLGRGFCHKRNLKLHIIQLSFFREGQGSDKNVESF